MINSASRRQEGRVWGEASHPVFSLSSFTMLDFPDHTACIIWMAGCNMRCPYCHNPQIVKGKGKLEISAVLEFLQKRQGLLDGVVLSGGEATSYPHLLSLMSRIKDLGYAIKLDTNGTRPKVLKAAIQSGLIDYVALDYKAPRDKFRNVSGISKFEEFSSSLDLLCRQSSLPFEIRTTVHTALLQEDDINQIILDLDQRGFQGTYYVQNFISDNDRPTLGQMPVQARILDCAALVKPHSFQLATRNFPDAPAVYASSLLAKAG